MTLINSITILFVLLSALSVGLLHSKNKRIKRSLDVSDKNVEHLCKQLHEAIRKSFRVGDVVYVHRDVDGYFGLGPYYIYELYNDGQYAKLTDQDDWEHYSKTTASLAMSNAIAVMHISHKPLECCNKCGKPLNRP